jgi:hypothetical protein
MAWSNGTGWQWESLGGQAASGLSGVSWGANRVDVFARRADGSLLHRFYQ